MVWCVVDDGSMCAGCGVCVMYVWNMWCVLYVVCAVYSVYMVCGVQSMSCVCCVHGV